ncbi:MAG: hypothetical protein QNK36_00375 [Colwellia sp.]|nr:hypothetical protein [Colwellia sp.]
MDEKEIKQMTDKAIIEITNVCNLGGFARVSSFIPHYVSHSYNRILYLIGENFGWVDRKKMLVESESIIKDIESYVGYFIKAHESLIDFGIDSHSLKLMSPVLVIDAYVAGKHSLFSSITISNLYLFLSLAKLIEALELFEKVSNDNTKESCRTNHLVEAQSHLLIAFEASNRAIEIEFKSKTRAISEYFEKDEVERLLILEGYKQKTVQYSIDRKGGGQRPTYWKGHKDVIRKHLSKYETYKGNKKDKCILLITEEVKLKTKEKIIPEIKDGTFNRWLKNYREFGKPFL